MRGSIGPAFAMGLAALACAVPAPALPPPVPVRLLIVAPDDQVQAKALSLAYVAFLEHHQYFGLRDDPPVAGTFALHRCADDACRRGELRRSVAEGALSPVLLAVRSRSESEVEWRCIGVGEADANPGRQSIVLDLRAGMFASGQEERRRVGQLATQCILAAQSEGGG